jgi:hypothetical protein
MTRRYHGLLIAALPVPLSRTVMLDFLVETLRLADGRSLRLGVQQIASEDASPDHGHLVEFRLEQGLPVWRFEADGIVVQRRAVLLHRRNTVVLSWRLLDGVEGATLQLRPFVHFRAHDAPLSEDPGRVYRFFALLGEKQIKRGAHRSTKELEAAIAAYLDVRNADPKPFRWTKTAPTICSHPSETRA